MLFVQPISLTNSVKVVSHRQLAPLSDPVDLDHAINEGDDDLVRLGRLYLEDHGRLVVEQLRVLAGPPSPHVNLLARNSNPFKFCYIYSPSMVRLGQA